MAKNQTSIIKIYTQLYLYYISTLIFMYYSKIIMKNVTVAFIKFQHFCFKDMTNKAKTPRIYNMKRGRKNEKSNMLDIRRFFFIYLFSFFHWTFLSVDEWTRRRNEQERKRDRVPCISFHFFALSTQHSFTLLQHKSMRVRNIYTRIYIFFFFVLSITFPISSFSYERELSPFSPSTIFIFHLCFSSHTNTHITHYFLKLIKFPSFLFNIILHIIEIKY